MKYITVAVLFQQFIPTIPSWRVSILVAALVQFCVAFFVEVKYAVPVIVLR